MKISITTTSTHYQLNVAYSVSASLTETWDLLATDAGFAKWFPELHIEGQKLVFEMEDFREEMDLLAYREPHEIVYTWDTARVGFILTEQEGGSHIAFEEFIPKDFGNEFATAEKDMTGWLIQHECIQALLEGAEVPEQKPLQEKWSHFVQEQI
ncbi:ATPase [Streptococcus suis]|uniref:ATPase n=1 Tax=Streptococcus suis TaxID=1307 RepID=A0A3R8R958_STRSU|nr:ATPase [Streptococcus suis]